MSIFSLAKPDFILVVGQSTKGQYLDHVQIHPLDIVDVHSMHVGCIRYCELKTIFAHAKVQIIPATTTAHPLVIIVEEKERFCIPISEQSAATNQTCNRPC